MKQMVAQAVRDIPELRRRLSAIPALALHANEPLSRHTRFGIGGSADLLVVASASESFMQALTVTRETGLPWVVIGGGSNLIVSDAGFRGAVLSLAAGAMRRQGECAVFVESGAVLQDLVDFTIAQGLFGLHTMTGIPGWVGAAIYGNAGAYGHSISERVHHVRFFDGDRVREFDNAACEFHYRESIFKKHRDWIVLDALLHLQAAPAADLARTADDILRVRNEKYPPTMKCAGSIFKNYLFAELPPEVQAIVPAAVTREGKVPAAWFLEQVGAKGFRVGDIQVASYHANLIYNDGAGSAYDLVAVIQHLKQLIAARFHMPLEEEVQYVGDFPARS